MNRKRRPYVIMNAVEDIEYDCENREWVLKNSWSSTSSFRGTGKQGETLTCKLGEKV